jgi:hypothetical protein
MLAECEEDPLGALVPALGSGEGGCGTGWQWGSVAVWQSVAVALCVAQWQGVAVAECGTVAEGGSGSVWHSGSVWLWQVAECEEDPLGALVPALGSVWQCGFSDTVAIAQSQLEQWQSGTVYQSIVNISHVHHFFILKIAQLTHFFLKKNTHKNATILLKYDNPSQKKKKNIQFHM